MSLALSLTTILGCQTTKTNEIVFPPEPERVEMPYPQSERDYALLVVYYDSLLRQWEEWAKAVKAQNGENE